MITCGMDCRHKSDKRCSLEELTISKDGKCECFEKTKNFYGPDNVVIFDDEGIPSIMVRFERPKDGSEDQLFTIRGELYDEMYISKYKNCNINGKPYSLPYQKPWTNASYDEAEKACFSKGKGWHLMTAAEHGYLARLALKNGTLPHGNTDKGCFCADEDEKCELYNGYQMLTGSGPDTWYHDHTIFGVDGLCGDTWEWMRGLRLMNGKIQTVDNNDAASRLDLSCDSDNWKNIWSKDNRPIAFSCNNRVKISDEETEGGYSWCRWKDVQNECSENADLYRLGLFAGDPENYVFADTEGERLPLCGGAWGSGARAGVFGISLYSVRTNAGSNIGFRSAFYGKLHN